jgi:2,4-diketo-3-deoxy-L-fuconate hydrolase
MIIISRILCALTVSGMLTLLSAYPIFSQILPGNHRLRPAGQQFTIKPLAEAISLGRFLKKGKVHILAVLQDDGAQLTGIDLSNELKLYPQHSFDLIRNLAYDEVLRIINKSSHTIVVNYEDLLPSISGDQHLAIGINYPEHGKETGQVRPFMFPKLLSTDPAVHQLHHTSGWLLDHEVELGIVFPSAVCSDTDLNHILIGFLVVNDFTDRATLMQLMDSKDVTGGKGFPDAKSKTGFLPTGPYMVIPRDWRSFVRELQLQLSVNGELRQRGYARDMVWNIDTIIQRSISVKGESSSYYQNKMVPLFKGDCIPANSIIITGTPSGVVFKAPSKVFITASVIKYVFTGGFLSRKMHPYILQQYLKRERKNPRYLKPGDQVESWVSFLGRIKTTIKEDYIK